MWILGIKGLKEIKKEYQMDSLLKCTSAIKPKQTFYLPDTMFMAEVNSRNHLSKKTPCLKIQTFTNSGNLVNFIHVILHNAAKQSTCTIKYQTMKMLTVD